MASNVIQQNRQRHSQHRQNCSRYLKLKSNRRCLKHQLKLKHYLSQQEQKSDEIQDQHADQENAKERTIKHRKPRAASSKPKPNAFIQQVKQFKLKSHTSFEEFSEGIYRLFTASILMRFLLLLTFGQIVAGEGNIGCNFMRTLCLPGSEVCFDDNIFGKCIPIAGVDVEDIDRTPLTEDQSEKLATILLELQGAGLGWDHPYVQCRIQGQLFSMQRHTRLPPNLCANLAPIPSENDRNGDLAYVRFIPPLEDYVDAQDETEHNLLYYPPMKKQASVDTIFHELQQQELQRQRQQYQPNQSRQPTHLDFLQYGGFDDRSFRKPNHPANFPGNSFIENDRKHYPQDREISQTELDLARRKLYRMMSEYGLDPDVEENPYQRNYEEDSSSLTGMYGPDQLNLPNQPPNFFNPYMGGGTAVEDDSSFYPSELDLARNRFHQMLADQDINEQNKRHNFMNTFTGNQRGHFDDQDGNMHNNFGPSQQKLYQVLSAYGLEKDPPDNRFLKAFEKTINNNQDFDSDNAPPMFENLGFKASYGEQSPNDFENFRRMENKEPPREEPNHRSFFRELAVEQGIKQDSPPQHEDKHAELHNQEDKSFDATRLIDKDRSDGPGQYLLGNSLVRNSLKPFEEEAILSSNPFAHKPKHQKVDKVFTEGGLVLVPQNSYQNDEAPFNIYDGMEDVDLEKEKAREFLADMLGFTRHERLDVKKPGPMMGPPDSANNSADTKNTTKKTETKEVLPTHIKGSNEAHKKKKVIVDDFSEEDSASLEDEFDYLYVYFKNPVKDREDAERIMIVLSEILHMQGFFDNLTILDNGVSFRVNSNNPEHKTSMDMAKYITDSKGVKKNILRRLGVTVLGANVGSKYKAYEDDDGVSVITPYTPSVMDMAFFSLVLIFCVTIAGISIFMIVYHRRVVREKLNLLAKGGVVTGMESCSKDYQDLCRARMAGKGNTSEPVTSGRITSLTKENERPPSSRSSTSSWCEEPALTNMDISTGHMVLSYMEDHLRNKGRLQREWEALCRYEAEPSAREAAQQAQCANFNRSGAPLPYDHSRVVLNHLANAEGLDYINASSITDHDPRAPAYVAAQGPLPTTLAHFWQMIWEQGAVVIVSLCRLQENGDIACARYWPEEGAEVYHIYEVNLVSEHIWCDDYLVRSFYLKNLRTSETRTVTQFHFLSWPPNGVPAQAKALLDFRRKVNKSYRGRSCPIVVHGSTGAGRTGAYILLDLVLGRMNKGAREIDIAATLEHLRDQRAGLVATRQQFEFVLMAVAEEVHAILKALPANQSNEKKDIEGNKDGNGTNGSASGGALTGGVGSVAGVVLKEEEAENTEEEAKPACVTSAATTTQAATSTATPKENEGKSNGNKNGTPAKNSGNNSTTSTTSAHGGSGQKKK